MLSMSSNKNTEPGIPMTKMTNPWSHLSLNSCASKQPVFILKDGKKVSLNAKLIQGL